MTANGAGKAAGTRRPGAGSSEPAPAARSDRPVLAGHGMHESPAGLAARNGTETIPIAAALGPSVAAWQARIEWAARGVVPHLARTALVSVFVQPSEERSAVRPRPDHLLIQTVDRADQEPAITPVISRSLDVYTPFAKVADSATGQLWRIDAALVDVIEPGTSAIGVPFAIHPSVVATLTLLRPPDQPPFSLDDLLTLEHLIAGDADRDAGQDEPPESTGRWQPAVLTPSIYVHGLRTLMHDLSVADTPYAVARGIAQAAQTFFEAQSCVVYFIDPAQSGPQGSDPSLTVGTGPWVRLQLAASVGSGVLLTPPWLEPAATATTGTLFASTADGTVLIASLDGGEPWVERKQSDDVLIALPLRFDGRLVAVLGMRRPEGLETMRTITAGNFALIAANALLASWRRETDQSSILVLRSELARTRLVHDATLAMFAPADALAGVEAHAVVLVPGLADGYLVYLDPAAVQRLAGNETREGIGAERVFSHWREHRTPGSLATLEAWVDDRLRATLRQLNGSAGQLPLFLSEADPEHDATPRSGQADPPAMVRSLAAVPLVRDGRVFGALVLVTSEHGRRYGQRDFALIASLVAPVAQRLSVVPEPKIPRRDPAPWDHASETGLDATSPLVGLATRLIKPLEVSEIGQLVARTLATLLGDWCVIELRTLDGEPGRTYGAHTETGRPWPSDLWAHLSRNRDAARGPLKVLRTGRSDLSIALGWLDRVSDGGEGEAALCPTLIPASSVSAAIHDDDGVIGVVSCFRASPALPFTLDDLATLETVATISGAAIGTARQRLTEHEATTRQRLLAEQRARILAQLADAVVVIDQDRQIVFANDAARELHGGKELPHTVEGYVGLYQPRDINGTFFTDRTFPLSMALTTGARQHGNWSLRLSDQAMVAVAGAVRPVLGADGAASGAVLSLHDVTASLEQEATQRQFLLEISDEISHPISSIKGWAQYLGQRLQTPGEMTLDSRAVDAIGKQTRLLQRLVERFVLASQSALPEGVAVQPQSLDILDLLGHLARAVQERSPGRSISLSVMPPGPVIGRWDPETLEQIFGNLLANAIGSSPTMSPIEITVERQPDTAMVAVTDHGTGIDPERQAGLFVSGSVAEVIPTDGGNEPADAVPGTVALGLGPGLDLPTVADLVSRLRGRISLRSTVGVGSTFTVELPLNQ